VGSSTQDGTSTPRGAPGRTLHTFRRPIPAAMGAKMSRPWKVRARPDATQTAPILCHRTDNPRIRMSGDNRGQQSVVRSKKEYVVLSRDSNKSTGSTDAGVDDATVHGPSGKYPNAGQPEARSAGRAQRSSCVDPTILASGNRVRIDALHDPDKRALCPKSVVIVMTPDGFAEMGIE